MNTSESSSSADSSIGTMRFLNDKRQIAGLLMVTGFCAIIQPMFGVAGAIGADGNTETEGLAFATLFGGLCVMTIGALSVFVGYIELVHDWGSKYLTGFLLLLTQTAYIPYISGMTNVGRGITDGNFFGFGDYAAEATLTDQRFVGAMGILGIMAYGFALVGTIAFLQFSLFAFQSGKAADRNSGYFKGRGLFYSGMLFLAGFSQLLLGAYTLNKGPVAVAVYLIQLHGIAIFIGLIQVLAGLWGIARSTGICGCDNDYFQMALAFVWFAQLVLQAVTQASYAPGVMFAGNAPTVAAFSFSLSLMPAFLDYKARNLPEEITAEYYGMENTFTEHMASDSKDDGGAKDAV